VQILFSPFAGFTKLLVAGGEDSGGKASTVEVINLSDLSSQCQDLPRFPNPGINQFAGLVLNHQPLIGATDQTYIFRMDPGGMQPIEVNLQSKLRLSQPHLFSPIRFLSLLLPEAAISITTLKSNKYLAARVGRGTRCLILR